MNTTENVVYIPHTVEYYSVIKDEVNLFQQHRWNFRMLGEVSQQRKTNTVQFYLYAEYKKQTIKQKSKINEQTKPIKKNT